MVWTVNIRTVVKGASGEIEKAHEWTYETEDESLIARIVTKAPFLGVRTAIREYEQQNEEEEQNRRKIDTLAREMKQFYDAIRLCGSPLDALRTSAKEELVRGFLLAKGFDEARYDAAKEKAVHADVVTLNNGSLVMMIGFKQEAA